MIDKSRQPVPRGTLPAFTPELNSQQELMTCSGKCEEKFPEPEK